VPPGPDIRRASACLAALLAALLLGAGPAVASSPRVEVQPTLSAAIVERLNDVRRERGLRRLDVSPGLARAAREHALDMGREGYFSHSSREIASVSARLARYYPGSGRPGWSVGEVLFWTVGRASAAEVVEAWLGSPTHHRAIRDDWDDVGVGAVVAANAPGVFGGRTVTIVVADFGSRG
jgi:uncharacterized protein YkwD